MVPEAQGLKSGLETATAETETQNVPERTDTTDVGRLKFSDGTVGPYGKTAQPIVTGVLGLLNKVPTWV